MITQPLGDSPFNYNDYSASRFHHYWLEIEYVRRYGPRRMLEIGPGDHTVTDFFRRKGVYVRTLDNDPRLFPDYAGDVRTPFPLSDKFDIVLACEVFEHMDIDYLPVILENIQRVLEPDGHLIISLPYTTLRFFPPRPDHGRVISCEGRLKVRLPYSVLQLALTPLSVSWRLLKGIKPAKAFEVFGCLPPLPDDHFQSHHWDLGYWPTTRREIRKLLRSRMTLVEERAYLDDNCVFYVLRSKKGPSM